MTETLPSPQTPEQEKAEYVSDLHKLAAAKAYITRVFGEEDSMDFMIGEIKEYVTSGKFSKYVEEYALKEKPPLTEAEIAATLPKTWDGKPIWSYKDL